MPKNRGTDAQLLTLQELAVYLHLDEQTVGKLVTAGKVPALQVERQWRFKRTAIDAWIEEQLVGDDENMGGRGDGSHQARIVPKGTSSGTTVVRVRNVTLKAFPSRALPSGACVRA